MGFCASENNFGQSVSRIEKFNEEKYENQKKISRRINSANKNIKGMTKN